MALQIDTSINILGNVQAPGLYLRMFYSSDIQGKQLHISIEKFLNKSSFQDNKFHTLEIEGIPYQLEVPYNRITDGVDTLMFVHNKVKDHLSTNITQEVARMDSRGVVTDASGNVVFDEVIIIPKFTDAENISIVDINE